VQTRAQCSWLTGLPGHVVRGQTSPFNPKSLFGWKRTMAGDVGGPSTCYVDLRVSANGRGVSMGTCPPHVHPTFARWRCRD